MDQTEESSTDEGNSQSPETLSPSKTMATRASYQASSTGGLGGNQRCESSNIQINESPSTSSTSHSMTSVNVAGTAHHETLPGDRNNDLVDDEADEERILAPNPSVESDKRPAFFQISDSETSVENLEIPNTEVSDHVSDEDTLQDNEAATQTSPQAVWTPSESNSPQSARSGTPTPCLQIIREFARSLRSFEVENGDFPGYDYAHRADVLLAELSFMLFEWLCPISRHKNEKRRSKAHGKRKKRRRRRYSADHYERQRLDRYENANRRGRRARQQDPGHGGEGEGVRLETRRDLRTNSDPLGSPETQGSRFSEDESDGIVGEPGACCGPGSTHGRCSNVLCFDPVQAEVDRSMNDVCHLESFLALVNRYNPYNNLPPKSPTVSADMLIQNSSRCVNAGCQHFNSHFDTTSRCHAVDRDISFDYLRRIREMFRELDDDDSIPNSLQRLHHLGNAADPSRPFQPLTFGTDRGLLNTKVRVIVNSPLVERLRDGLCRFFSDLPRRTRDALFGQVLLPTREDNLTFNRAAARTLVCMIGEDFRSQEQLPPFPRNWIVPDNSVVLYLSALPANQSSDYLSRGSVHILVPVYRTNIGQGEATIQFAVYIDARTGVRWYFEERGQRVECRQRFGSYVVLMEDSRNVLVLSGATLLEYQNNGVLPERRNYRPRFTGDERRQLFSLDQSFWVGLVDQLMPAQRIMPSMHQTRPTQHQTRTTHHHRGATNIDNTAVLNLSRRAGSEESYEPLSESFCTDSTAPNGHSEDSSRFRCMDFGAPGEPSDNFPLHRRRDTERSSPETFTQLYCPEHQYQTEIEYQFADTRDALAAGTASTISSPTRDPLAEALSIPTTEPLAATISSPTREPLAATISSSTREPLAETMSNPPREPLAATISSSTRELLAATISSSTRDFLAATISSSTRELLAATISSSTRELLAATISSSTRELLAATISSSTRELLAATISSSTREALATTISSPTREPLAPTISSPTRQPLAATISSSTREPLAATISNPTREPLATTISSPTREPLVADTITPVNSPTTQALAASVNNPTGQTEAASVNSRTRHALAEAVNSRTRQALAAAVNSPIRQVLATGTITAVNSRNRLSFEAAINNRTRPVLAGHVYRPTRQTEAAAVNSQTRLSFSAAVNSPNRQTVASPLNSRTRQALAAPVNSRTRQIEAAAVNRLIRPALAVPVYSRTRQVLATGTTTTVNSPTSQAFDAALNSPIRPVLTAPVNNPTRQVLAVPVYSRTRQVLATGRITAVNSPTRQNGAAAVNSQTGPALVVPVYSPTRQALTTAVNSRNRQALAAVVNSRNRQALAAAVNSRNRQALAAALNRPIRQVLAVPVYSPTRQALAVPVYSRTRQALAVPVYSRTRQVLATGTMSAVNSRTRLSFLADVNSPTRPTLAVPVYSRTRQVLYTGSVTAVNSPTRQALAASVHRPTNQTIAASVNNSTSQHLTAAVNNTTRQTLAATVNNSTNQTVTATRNNSTSQTVAAAVNRPTNQTVAAAVNNLTSQTVAASVNNSTSQTVAASVNNSTSQTVAASVNNSNSQTVAASVNSSTSQTVAAAVNNSTSQTVAASVNRPTNQTIAAAVNRPTNQTVAASVNNQRNSIQRLPHFSPSRIAIYNMLRFLGRSALSHRAFQPSLQMPSITFGAMSNTWSSSESLYAHLQRPVSTRSQPNVPRLVFDDVNLRDIWNRVEESVIPTSRDQREDAGPQPNWPSELIDDVNLRDIWDRAEESVIPTSREQPRGRSMRDEQPLPVHDFILEHLRSGADPNVQSPTTLFGAAIERPKTVGSAQKHPHSANSKTDTILERRRTGPQSDQHQHPARDYTIEQSRRPWPGQQSVERSRTPAFRSEQWYPQNRRGGIHDTDDQLRHSVPPPTRPNSPTPEGNILLVPDDDEHIMSDERFYSLLDRPLSPTPEGNTLINSEDCTPAMSYEPSDSLTDLPLSPTPESFTLFVPDNHSMGMSNRRSGTWSFPPDQPLPQIEQQEMTGSLPIQPPPPIPHSNTCDRPEDQSPATSIDRTRVTLSVSPRQLPSIPEEDLWPIPEARSLAPHRQPRVVVSLSGLSSPQNQYTDQ